MAGVIGLIVLFCVMKFLYLLCEEKKDTQGENNTNSLLLYEEATSQIKLKESETKASKMKEQTKEQKGTRDLLMETLTKIGCQYEIVDRDGDDRIIFAYQGEHFVADTSNDIKFVHVYDIQWEHIELYDIDEFSRMKRAINEANMHVDVTTLYTIDEAGSNVFVHSKKDFLFIPQIPDLKKYLKAMLSSFFQAHRLVSIEMDKIREKESKA